MRHKNIYNGSLGWHIRHNAYLPEPYGNHIEYKHPSMTRVYCKILQYIFDHPNCKRKDVIVNIWFGNRMRKMYEDRVSAPDDVWLPKHKAQFREYLEKWDRGDFSWVTYNPSKYFAELLWADLIDYDEKTFKYHVTNKGKKLLEEAYLNDNIKSVTGNFPWQKHS